MEGFNMDEGPVVQRAIVLVGPAERLDVWSARSILEPSVLQNLFYRLSSRGVRLQTYKKFIANRAFRSQCKLLPSVDKWTRSDETIQLQRVSGEPELRRLRV